MIKPILNNFLSEVKNDIAIFTINRPQVRNAMNNECWEDVLTFVTWIDNNPNIHVAIITGSGDQSFISGADLNTIKQLNAVAALNSKAMKALKAISCSNKIFIAAVNGYAFGGGCELSLSCDLRIVSQNARFGFPETGIGLLPGAGGTQRLPKIVGISITKEMILAGRVLDADEAVQYGLAMKSVPLLDLMKETLTIAKNVANKSPLALGLAKQCIQNASAVDENTGLIMENQSFSILMASEDKQEGINSFFEKRLPQFKNK